MDVAGAQVQVTTDHGEISHQVQNRLLHIDTQMAHIQAQVERLITEASTSSSQFTVLLRHMTDRPCTCPLRINTAGSPVDHHRIKKF
jgi:hypothetical protein